MEVSEVVRDAIIGNSRGSFSVRKVSDFKDCAKRGVSILLKGDRRVYPLEGCKLCSFKSQGIEVERYECAVIDSRGNFKIVGGTLESDVKELTVVNSHYIGMRLAQLSKLSTFERYKRFDCIQVTIDNSTNPKIQVGRTTDRVVCIIGGKRKLTTNEVWDCVVEKVTLSYLYVKPKELKVTAQETEIKLKERLKTIATKANFKLSK